MPYDPNDMPAMESRIFDLKMEIDRLAHENLGWEYDRDNQWSIFHSMAEDITDAIAFEEFFDENVEGIRELANFHGYEDVVKIVHAVIRELERMYTP